jgi:hypothetical protein
VGPTTTVDVVVYVIVVVELIVMTLGMLLHEEGLTVVVLVMIALGPEAAVPVGTTVLIKSAQKELAKGAA